MMGKVTIYLPDELEEQVRGAGVSMSPVCQEALASEVRKARARTDEGDLQVVADRLRSTLREEEEQQYQEGFALGAKWARERATLSALEQIANMSCEMWLSIGLVDQDTDETNSLADFIFEEKGVECHRLDYRDPYSRGIVRGAANVHKEVAPML